MRTNARTTELEEAFHEAGLPFQGASLLDRDAARQLLKALRREASAPVAEAVRRTRRSRRGSSRIRRRSSATASRRGRPTSRGSSVSPSSSRARSSAEFARLAARALRRERRPRRPPAHAPPREGSRVGRGPPAAARGGRAAEPARPRRRARRGAAAASTSGLTRAKRHLLLTWSGRPSRFLDELGVRVGRRGHAGRPRSRVLEQTPAVLALKEWRLARAKAEEVPAYVVFNDRTLAELVARIAPHTRRVGRRPGHRPGEARALRAPSCSPSSPASPDAPLAATKAAQISTRPAPVPR